MRETAASKARKAAGKPAKSGSAADDRRREEQLDEALQQTFPASDPIAIHPGSGS
jgi:hypothetical protein